MSTGTPSIYIPPSLFESGFSQIRDTFIATKKLLAPAARFLAERVMTAWVLSLPYVHAVGTLLSTQLGFGVACIGASILPIGLSQILQGKSKLLAAISLVAGIAIAITGFYYLGASGVLPALRITRVV